MAKVKKRRNIKIETRIKTWTNEKIAINYTRLCEMIKRRKMELDMHDCRDSEYKCVNMYEHMKYCSNIKSDIEFLQHQMVVILKHAKKRGVPIDRSEGTELCNGI